MKSSRNIQTIKTARGSNIHSVPNSHRSKYLDLFMLQNERDRLNREYEIYKAKLQQKLIQLNEVDEQINALSHEHPVQKRAASSKCEPEESGKKQNWDMLRMEY